MAVNESLPLFFGTPFQIKITPCGEEKKKKKPHTHETKNTKNDKKSNPQKSSCICNGIYCTQCF